MPVVDSGLKDAVWLMLEITSHQQPGAAIHSDFVTRRFPKMDESELLNAIKALVDDGKITVKASSVDADGRATAYHIRMKGQENSAQDAAIVGGPEFTVGLGASSSVLAGSSIKVPDSAKPIGLSTDSGKIVLAKEAQESGEASIGSEEEPKTEQRANAIANDADQADAQQQAEEHFADEVGAFFAEIASAPTSREEDKRQLIDQLAVIMAMFQSADAESFTTPIAKLASLKTKVHLVAPELVRDYILLCQTALRAWLGRV